MKINFTREVLIVAAMGVVVSANAQTYGNTSPFATVSVHSQDYVLGVQVVIPSAMTLSSFGLIYGMPGSSIDISNAIFGIYDSGVTSALPNNLIAVTNPINLNSSATYDNIAFTSTPTIGAGTYWMMAMYESTASPRMDTSNPTSLVAYWSNTYSNGMPSSAPGMTTYQGQNFNYWVNGAVPEPGSLLALGLGAVALMRRRKA